MLISLIILMCEHNMKPLIHEIEGIIIFLFIIHKLLNYKWYKLIFSEKTTIPFGTSSSSTFTVNHLKNLNSTGIWQEPHRFSSSANATTINT